MENGPKSIFSCKYYSISDKQVTERDCTCAARRAHTDLPLGVAEDDGLCDGERVVEVTQRVKLPLLALDRHEELLDALQRQLITATTRRRKLTVTCPRYKRMSHGNHH